ncbi:hypothetical protein [Lapillicoccus jejuensis]|uniref:Phosphopantetheinyl transferase n=1 Tax=Lapillicoccus jejuensis TaxID=402171 RepID=A0A542DV77_9MICO|nr:hypothetical protein [Lapillicoccus jejuensis]TQJ06968.1 phosphopantetheinyl transferase [Lapillicoccus jejuensis]
MSGRDAEGSVVVVVEAVAPRGVGPGDLAGLSDGERARVAEASSWVAVSRAAGYRLVRAVLGERLGTRPGAVRLDRTCPGCGRAHGRIRVLDDPALSVSVSRAGRPPGAGTPARVGPPVVAVAVTRLAPVGLDLAWAGEPDFAGFDDVARHPEDGGLDAAVLWARKEASLKAVGSGLTIDPASFPAPRPGAVTRLGPDDAPVVVSDLDPDRLTALVGGRGVVPPLVGAVALCRPDPSVPVDLTQRRAA